MRMAIESVSFHHCKYQCTLVFLFLLRSGSFSIAHSIDPITRIDPPSNYTTSSYALPSGSDQSKCSFIRTPTGGAMVVWSAVSLIRNDTSATERRDCELECCSLDQCQLIALASNSCLLLSCSATSAESCLTSVAPVTDPEYLVSYITGNIVTVSSDSVNSSVKSNHADRTTAVPAPAAAVSAAAAGVLGATQQTFRSSNLCSLSPTNNTYSPSGASAVPSSSGSDGKDREQREDSLMSAGDCDDGQKCVSLPRRPGLGLCLCEAPYQLRLPSSGLCVPIPATGAGASGAWPPSRSGLDPVGVTVVTSWAGKSERDRSDDSHIPPNSANLTAVVPADLDVRLLHYRWSLVSSSPPANSSTAAAANSSTAATAAAADTVVGLNSSTLQLFGLHAGVHVFRVDVFAARHYGNALANISLRANCGGQHAPMAIIVPASPTVHLFSDPPEILLDGSRSFDPDSSQTAAAVAPLKYRWRLLEAPATYTLTELPVSLATSDSVQLQQLVPGNFTVELTVEDCDHVTGLAVTTVTVVPGTGLPSTSGPPSPSVRPATLLVSVTDVVNITLPRSWTLLVASLSLSPASNSSAEWLWSQISGASTGVILNATTATANVTSLTRGQYVFQFTARVNRLTTSANVTVNVFQGANGPPVADAGGNLTVRLPVTMVTLNGSRSRDDRAVIGWRWSRDAASPAAGDVIGRTDTSSVLQLVNMAAGRYRFTLTVTDAEGESGRDTVQVTVLPDPDLESRVTLEFDIPYEQVSWSERQLLPQQLSQLLSSALHHTTTATTPAAAAAAPPAVLVQLVSWWPAPLSGRLLAEVRAVECHARTARSSHDNAHTGAGCLDNSHPLKFVPSPLIVQLVQSHIISTTSSSPATATAAPATPPSLCLRLLRAFTSVCVNRCSERGVCDAASRRCVCRTFWLENPLRLYWGDGQPNCDWSVLYVIIVSFTCCVLSFIACWLLVLTVRRRRRASAAAAGGGSCSCCCLPSYRPLVSQADDNCCAESVEMIHKGGKGSFSTAGVLSSRHHVTRPSCSTSVSATSLRSSDSSDCEPLFDPAISTGRHNHRHQLHLRRLSHTSSPPLTPSAAAAATAHTHRKRRRRLHSGIAGRRSDKQV